MTTATFNTTFAHTTTAQFQAWGSELNTQFAAAGLVQTSDTGQINWTTVAYTATTNTIQGYEIWRLPDSTLYFKFSYGTGNSATIPLIQIQVGQGSNGSGTLTGQTSTNAQVTFAAAPTVGVYYSYISVTNNAVMLAWKVASINSGNSPQGIFVVGKTVASTGATNTTGYGVLTNFSGNTSGALQLQPVRMVSGTGVLPNTYPATQYYSIWPMGQTNSIFNYSTQCVNSWLNLPDIYPFPWGPTYVNAESGKFSTFVTGLVNSVNHTYIRIGTVGASTLYGNSAGNTSYGLAVIFE